MVDREVRRPKTLPADAAASRYRITFRDSTAQKSWDILATQRRTDMTECWDHLAYRALENVRRKCKPLVGRFAKSGLRQFTVGPKQRVWYRVAGTHVTIVDVHRAHPKGTE